MASFLGKSELSGIWKERFQDVSKLNEYTQKGLKVELGDVIIKDYKLSAAIFNNASFRDVEWTNTITEKLSFTNTVFRNNTFSNVEFTNAKFTNVTFEDSEFYGTSFYLSQMTGVKFIHCKFMKKSDFVQLKDSTIEFEYTTFESNGTNFEGTSFAKSKAALIFRDSTLTDLSLTDFIFPSSLTFENSKLQDIDMDRSKLAKLVMDNVTGGGQSGCNDGSIAEVEIRNSEMSFGLNDGTYGKIHFVNSKINSTFNNAHIKELKLSNCKGMASLGLYQSPIDSLQISNCPINNFRPIEATIQNLRIDNSSIENSKLKKMKVVNFTLTDVSLDGQLDFSNAQVENLITKNITQKSGLNLNLTGSNVKF